VLMRLTASLVAWVCGYTVDPIYRESRFACRR
jgi:hypothetical protein